MTYDSTADTLAHSRRVGELMGGPIIELVARSTCHDLSKTREPEKAAFDEYTPRLAESPYGSAQYRANLAGLAEALDHHYDVNRHHPEHFPLGIEGMTLVDVIEMLADWKASTERHPGGDLATSLELQRERFAIGDQLMRILGNTARHYGWLR